MGKPATQQLTQLQIIVSLNAAAMEYATKNAREGDMPSTVGAWCSYYIDQQARGAILLEPSDHDFIAELADGKRFKSSRQLANAVAKGLKREEGQFESVAKIDPALIVPLQDHAAAMSWTVEELISNGLNQMLTNGWLASLEPENRILLTDEAMAKLRKIVGKNSFTGEEMVELLGKPEQTQEAAA